jgi:alcohol dehydrogenase class IV
MAHAVEGLYARDRNPVSSLMAAEGIRAFARALPALKADPADRAARTDALYAAWLCGTVLGAVEMGLHHKLCHVLGGSFGLPHAETHSVVLPHVAAFNEAAISDALKPVADALGAAEAGAGLHAFARSLGAPLALRDLGLSEEDLDRAADLAVEDRYRNPRVVSREDVRRLLHHAWAGKAPEA